MQFTDQEIILAKQLKEAGLEWIPEVGDWFLSDFNNAYLIPNQTAALNFNKQAGGTWLPLWHQCREVILGEGWHLTLIETPPQVEWRVHLVYERIVDKKTYCIEATGLTDLEAMYKAMGMLIPKKEDGRK